MKQGTPPLNPLVAGLLVLALTATGCVGLPGSDPPLPQSVGVWVDDCTILDATIGVLDDPNRLLFYDTNDWESVNLIFASDLSRCGEQAVAEEIAIVFGTDPTPIGGFARVGDTCGRTVAFRRSIADSYPADHPTTTEILSALSTTCVAAAPAATPSTSQAVASDTSSVDGGSGTAMDLGALLEKTRWAIVRTEGLGTGQVDNDRSWISFATGDEFGLTWGGGHNGCNGFVSEITWTEDGYEVPMIVTKTEPQIEGIMTSIGCPETSRIYKLFEPGRTVNVHLSGDTIVLTERSRQIEGVRVAFEIHE